MERALSAAGIAVTTATTDDDGPGRRLAPGLQGHALNGAVRVYRRKWLEFYKVAPSMVPWLWRHVREFDVVHIHALFSFASTVAALVARRRGVPYVVRPLGTLTAYGVTRRRAWLKRISVAALERSILRHAAAVHFTTQAEWDEAKLLGIPLRGVVIPLGVAPEASGDADSALVDHSQLRGRRVILYLSRLDRKKNVEALLGAFAAVASDRPDVSLLIAGGGEPAYVNVLMSLAHSLGVASRVAWLGHVEGAPKAAALGVADIFVLPSFSENFGIAAVEALLAGLPCVLARGVAIAREVEDAGAGLAVDPDSGAIARALGELLADEGRRRELGRRGRAFAEQTYSVDAMASRLTTLYRRLASPASRVSA
jgi:glycosyltransferase involved in cell wall biosynthesis